MTPRRRPLLLFVVCAAVLVALTGVAVVRRSLDVPLSDLDPPRTVLVPPRAGVRQVAAILEREGVIPRAWFFVLWSRLLGLERRIRYGEYTFGGPQTMKGIFDTLVSGKVTLHRLTVPEGYTLAQIAARVEEYGLGKSAELLTTARDEELLRRFEVAGPSLEGYCFPDTYLVPRDLPAEDLLERMVGRFREVFDDALRARAAELGLTVHEAVTLASIIEKESGLTAELPIISAVFHNRLRRGIPLMADPAVIYGIDGFDGKLRRSDLKRPGPYNVYLNKGLPPGPISNPGLKALRAALHPAEVDFLYFVSKNNGMHHFSRTLFEHNQAVALYQRGGG